MQYLPKQVVPHISPHQLGRITIECVTVKLLPEEWATADEASRNMWANSKKNTSYGRGIINTSDDPQRVERVGRLGEIAFSKISGLPVDLSYIEGGDSRDFQFAGGNLDIKTASKLASHKCGLIYAKSQHGTEIPLNSDYYIFGYVAHESREQQKATVVIVGWCDKEYVEKQPLVPAIVGFHFNKQIPYKNLHRIDQLLTLINPNTIIH